VDIPAWSHRVARAPADRGDIMPAVIDLSDLLEDWRVDLL
jgi:hypothetical protein